MVKKYPRHHLYLQKNYEHHAILQHEVANRMTEYLDDGVLNFHSILEFGARDLYLTHLLKEQFPQATIDAFDPLWQSLNTPLSDEYLSDSKWSEQTNHQYDLLISNCVFQDELDWQKTVEMFHTKLAANGLLFFSSLGLGSFQALQNAGLFLNPLPEIKALGNCLHALGFLKTVLHIEKITLTYQNLDLLFADLRITGALPQQYDQGLKTPRWKESLEKSLHADCFQEGCYRLEVEIIYAYAKMPDIINTKSATDVAYFPLDQLKSS